MCYCSPVWDGLNQKVAEKLQKLQNRTARAITGANGELGSDLVLKMLKWDDLSIGRKKNKVVLMFKVINNLKPQYLQKLFSSCNNNYDFRDCENKLALPKPRTNYLKRSFCYSGASSWNSLPSDLKLYESLTV